MNAVCPGYTDTDIVKNAIANIRKNTGRSRARRSRGAHATNPQDRLIEPARGGPCGAVAVPPGSESVTGQSIVLAGGEVM